MGDIWQPIYRAILNLDVILKADQNYFTAPDINCYTVSLVEKIKILEPLVNDICINNFISWDIELGSCMQKFKNIRS
jgi:hypothetical protein